jgi:prepilin-type N-terminal cleavage/methylation domain-containing protein
MLKRQDGFTLIEIIAVLVLLGILAAVAIPKYIDLQAQAELKAIQAVKAELNARANQYFAEYLLDPGTATAYDYTLAEWVSNENDLGDDFDLTAGTGAIVVEFVTTTNTFDIAFTQGSATSPAVFSTITAN